MDNMEHEDDEEDPCTRKTPGGSGAGDEDGAKYEYEEDAKEDPDAIEDKEGADDEVGAKEQDEGEVVAANCGTSQITTNNETINLIFASKIKALEQQVREQDEQITALKHQVLARQQVIEIMVNTMRNLNKTVYGYTRDFPPFLSAVP